MSFLHIAEVQKLDGLSMKDKFTLFMLASYADEAGSCFPSLSTLAKNMGCSRRTVAYAIESLQDKGYIQVISRFNEKGKQTTSRFVLTLDSGGAKSASLGVQNLQGEGAKSASLGVQNLHTKLTNQLNLPPEYLPPTPRADVAVTAATAEAAASAAENDPPEKSHFEDVELPLNELQPAAAPGKRHEQPATAPQSDFQAFWALFPKRRDKRAAERAWRAAIKNGANPADIIAGAERYAAERKNQDARYTKYPATWLNAGAWEDEPDPQPQESEMMQALKAMTSTPGFGHAPDPFMPPAGAALPPGGAR